MKWAIVLIAVKLIGGDGIEPLREVHEIRILGYYPTEQSCRDEAAMWLNKHVGIAQCLRQ